ncbi:MAG: cysteine desulfurase family protein [Ruminococcus sp.]
MEHYLDNSATTSVYREVAEKVAEIMTVNFGNPSSLHSKGMEAEDELIKARHIIAKSLGVEDNEIYFTSGGTEANNLAVLGAVNALKRRGNKIVTTAIEHSSVYETMKQLENQGFEVTYIEPKKDGNLSIEDFKTHIDKNTILVSLMAVNNEVGSILPFDRVSKIIKENNSPALLHCDCVQAYCKIPLKLKKSGIDLATVSGHKIHAPKGVGALYIKDGVRIIPQHFGGEQESKIRPGTEPLPLICGFAKAVTMADIEKNYQYISKLNSYAREKLSTIDSVVINSPENALPYIINISVKGIRSETMLHYLEQFEIYVSSGSACSKGKPSHVLQAMKLDRDLADSALRISFSTDNTEDDIDALCDAIDNGLKKLVRR